MKNPNHKAVLAEVADAKAAFNALPADEQSARLDAARRPGLLRRFFSKSKPSEASAPAVATLAALAPRTATPTHARIEQVTHRDDSATLKTALATARTEIASLTTALTAARNELASARAQAADAVSNAEARASLRVQQILAAAGGGPIVTVTKSNPASAKREGLTGAARSRQAIREQLEAIRGQ